MMCKKSLSRLFLRSFWHRVLPILLLTLIPMGLLSQTNEPKLNNSSATLQTWGQISAKFQNELTALRQNLQAALSDAQQSKTSLQKLTDLYENSLMRIVNLETYNDQIGQRIPESDEWNAELQTENVNLEAEVKIAKANGLRNAIIVGAGGIALGLLVPLIVKVLRRFKVIPV
jgi:outer membrane murein-binding lipoprotein Lpp